MTSTLEGRVVHKSSNDLRVDTPEGILRCSLRGRLRGKSPDRSPVVVGDRVEVSRGSESEGVLERILPRKTELTRSTAGGNAVTIAANVDRILIVLSALDPPPRWGLADRMIVSAQRESLEPAVCLNKWDQVEGSPESVRELSETLASYGALGYAVFRLSALRKESLAPLLAWLSGKLTVISGHSGVGKSTLLNALDPSLRLVTQEVNAVTGKGRHTTTAVTLYKLPSGGYVADTPGFREFLPVDMPPAELGLHFPELARVLPGCRFRDCLHHKEPDCAVLAAVEAGTISRRRYESYLHILLSLHPADPRR